MAYKEDHNVFVGSFIGSFKGIKLKRKNGIWNSVPKNLRTLDPLDNKQAVTAMSWGDDEKNILIGFANRNIEVYNSEDGSLQNIPDVAEGEGSICGISSFNGAVLVGTQSGHISIFSHGSDSKFEIGGPLEKIKHSPQSENVIAAGGKEKELQLWDLENKKCLFTAKNVRHDFLELRVPVWVSDIDFLPGSRKVAICSKYGHVRIYDPSTCQRRPVFDFHVPEQVFTACSVAASGEKIIVGSGTGRMLGVDIRGKGFLHHEYKGAVGSIRDIVCHPSEPLIFSVGLDRHLKVHSLESPKLLYKEYLQSKLNCVIVRKDFFYVHQVEDDVVNMSDGGLQDLVEKDNSHNVNVEKRGLNRLFANMKPVIDTHKAKRTKRRKT